MGLFEKCYDKAQQMDNVSQISKQLLQSATELQSVTVITVIEVVEEYIFCF